MAGWDSAAARRGPTNVLQNYRSKLTHCRRRVGTARIAMTNGLFHGAVDYVPEHDPVSRRDSSSMVRTLQAAHTWRSRGPSTTPLR